MKNLAIPLTLVAAATLAACGGLPDRRADNRYIDSGSTVTAVPYGTTGTLDAAKPGPARIVFLRDHEGPVNGISDQELTLRMADGSLQTITTRGRQFAMGQRVVVR